MNCRRTGDGEWRTTVAQQEPGLPDPAGRALDEVRATRDKVRTRVAALLSDLNSTQVPESG